MMESKPVWACRCGCLTHYIAAGGIVECANCGTSQDPDGGTFIDYLEAPKVDMPKNGPDNFRIIDMNSSDAALRRVANSIFERRDELALVLCIFANGRFRHWRAGMEPEEIEWVQKRLTEFKELIDEESRSRKAAEEARSESS